MQNGNSKEAMIHNLELSCKMQRDAWVNLSAICDDLKYTNEEKEFIRAMEKQANNFYNNRQEYIDKLLSGVPAPTMQEETENKM